MRPIPAIALLSVGIQLDRSGLRHRWLLAAVLFVGSMFLLIWMGMLYVPLPSCRC